MSNSRSLGFTLIELIAILVISAILASTAIATFSSNSTFQLQASRDQVVSAFFSAQQIAMSTDDSVRLIISAGNQVDIQVNGSSVNFAGVGYPAEIKHNPTISSATFAFDRLGQTSPATITLSKSGSSVDIQVYETGYVN